MIRFDSIELATYPNKPLDPMDFKAKEANTVYSLIVLLLGCFNFFAFKKLNLRKKDLLWQFF